MHTRRGGGNRLHIVDALRRFQNGMDQDRLAQFVSCLKLRQQLIEVVNVPGAIDLGQHDGVELVADGAHYLGDIVQRPWRIECVDTSP